MSLSRHDKHTCSLHYKLIILFIYCFECFCIRLLLQQFPLTLKLFLINLENVTVKLYVEMFLLVFKLLNV